MGWVALRWPWHAHRPLLLSVTQFNLSGHVAAAARSRKLNSLMQKEYFFFFSYPFMLSTGKQHVLVLWHWHTACLHINVNPKDLWTKRDGTSDFTCASDTTMKMTTMNDFTHNAQQSLSPVAVQKIIVRSWGGGIIRAELTLYEKSKVTKVNIGLMVTCIFVQNISGSVSSALPVSLKQAGHKFSLSALRDQMHNNFAGRSRYLHWASESVCECRSPHGCLASPTVPDLPLPWRPIGRAPDPLLSRPRWHPINAGLQCFYPQDRFPALGPNKKRLFCIYPSDWYKWLHRGERKLSGSFFFRSLLGCRTVQLKDNEPICQTRRCLCA